MNDENLGEQELFPKYSLREKKITVICVPLHKFNAYKQNVRGKKEEYGCAQKGPI